MLHGAGQFSRTWETTPDGREGFQNLFLRREFATYLVDQPRRGDAGRSMVGTTLTPTPDEQMWFNQFRLGTWPKLFPGVQFSDQPEVLDQFFRSMTPNTGPYDANVISDSMSALFDRIGDGILFTHSQGGGPGWLTAIKNPRVKGIVSFEPGSGFVFPEGEVPPPIRNAFDTVAGEPIPMEQFSALTKIPIVIYYGDNIPSEPTNMPAQDSWRARLADGPAVARRGESARRGRDRGAPSRARHPGQHPLPVLRPEQRPGSRRGLPVPVRERPRRQVARDSHTKTTAKKGDVHADLDDAGILSATAILAVAVAAPAHAGPAVIEVVPDGSRASSPASPNNFTGKAHSKPLFSTTRSAPRPH